MGCLLRLNRSSFCISGLDEAINIVQSYRLYEFLGFDLEDKDEIGKVRLDGTLEPIIHPDDFAAVKGR
jgi:hypothetical protein